MKYKYLLLLILLNTRICSANFYSQVGQDKYVYETFFKNKTIGTFIDIGAHDGETYSNSKFFEDLGWNGVCVEPLPEKYEKLEKIRKCKTINACVAPATGNVKFIKAIGANGYCLEMLSGMLDTYDPRHLSRLRAEIHNHGGTYEVVDVRAKNINEILDEANINHVDYLTLDTEGGELEILKTLDFSKYYIYIIDVENNYQDPHIKNFLQEKGFLHIHTMLMDEIYVNTKSPTN